MPGTGMVAQPLAAGASAVSATVIGRAAPVVTGTVVTAGALTVGLKAAVTAPAVPAVLALAAVACTRSARFGKTTTTGTGAGISGCRTPQSFRGEKQRGTGCGGITGTRVAVAARKALRGVPRDGWMGAGTRATAICVTVIVTMVVAVAVAVGMAVGVVVSL